MNNYKLFFENLNGIFRKHNSNSINFNIFSILRNESDEVNLHSKFIVELLKNNIFGMTMLKKFLEIIEVDFSDIKNSLIFFEYNVKNNGRIDILIKLESDTSKKAIVIENKIYAGDQYQQLKRYYDAMIEEGYKEEEIELVYLTLYGNEPSEYSTKGLSNEKKEKIRLISYKEDLILWIEEYIKESSSVSIIRETCVQYKELLKKLTGMEDMALVNELKELIFSNEEYIDILFALPNIIEKIEVDMQLKFWNRLEEKLTPALKSKGIACINEELIHNKIYSKKAIENFYKNNGKYYGLMYFIKEIPNRGKLYLRIEVERELYYGFRIIDSFGNSDKNDIDNYLKERLKNLGFTRTDWWLGLKYLTHNGNNINFKKLNKDMVKVLNDDELSWNLINDIVNEIVNNLGEIFNN